MALPVNQPVNVKYYNGTITSQGVTTAAHAAVCGRGTLIGARAVQGGAHTVDATLSLLVNGVTCTSGTITQTASGSATGTVWTFTPIPTAVDVGDYMEIRRASLGGTASTALHCTFIVKETTIGG